MGSSSPTARGPVNKLFVVSTATFRFRLFDEHLFVVFPRQKAAENAGH
jgi:hypothetical protein